MAIGGTPKPEISFLPGRLWWTLLYKERYDDSLRDRGLNAQPFNWEADTRAITAQKLLKTHVTPSWFMH